MKREIKSIYINSPGDPSVGIWGFSASIDNINVDIDDADLNEKDLDEVKNHIKEAFLILTGEVCSVIFDYEIPEELEEF